MDVIEQIIEKIEAKKSFVVEAGAGAGKTYALIQTINYLIEKRGANLTLNNQQIVCITYTNVAKNEITERLENNPMVLVSTIHEFLWECIKSFNKQLVVEFDTINTLYHEEKPEKHILELIKRINRVEYTDKTYSQFEEGIVGHDDLLILSQRMFSNYSLLTSILADKYPYLLVDEYQDTAPETITSLIDSLLLRNKEKLVIGFFGDSHQKIYDSGVGSLDTFITARKIEIITKVENYRSSHKVIDLLNNIRTNIKQETPEECEKPEGSIRFINCINYPEKTEGQKVLEYENSLIPTKNTNYNLVINELVEQGWNCGAGSKDKVLIIANSRVAKRGGFGDLYTAYSRRFGQGANEALLKRENPITALFIGSVDKKTSRERETGIEHLVSFYNQGCFGEIVHFLKRNGLDAVNLKKHSDKREITDKIDELINLRETKTIKDVFDYALNNKLILPSMGVLKFLERIETSLEGLDEDARKKIEKDITFYDTLMALPYIEYINCFKHTQNQDVFSTKHGTKGEEYRNVLVVIDDTSWKQKYNFEDYFNNSEETEARKERSKNLFYVSCSRAKENLVVLALSKMGDEAMIAVRNWFGEENVRDI